MTAPRSQRPRPLGMALEALVRGAAFLLVWWLLTGGEAGSWVIGAPVALAATGLSLALVPAELDRPWLRRLPRFAVYFLRESVAGGVDVVARALRPSMPLRPGFITVRMPRLAGPQRLLFAVLVSLMPGTLSARLDGETLHIHVLDTSLPLADGLERLQERLEALFGRRDERG